MATMPALVVFGYLAITLAIGIAAGRVGRGDVADYVAGERAFGPLVMYFVMGATVFSAYALLGTPQRVVAKGSDAFYILAYGAVGFVPVFYFGAKVRRLGARLGLVTQAELIGARFDSRAVTGWMGVATVLAFLPYLVIQLKGAGVVMQAVTGWSPGLGAFVVYAVVVAYVVIGGVRGVAWTNVLQGAAMLVIVWWLGLWVPHELFGGVAPMFDRVALERPDALVLPGPGPTGFGQYTSEILVSALGFSMWPQVFMKCFTARSARLVQLSAVLYPSFLFFLVPLLLLGYAALLAGGPADDSVLLWIVSRPELGDTQLVVAIVTFAVLAASMSTGDALLHAGASILVRDVGVVGLGMALDDRAQTRGMRVSVVVLAIVAFALLAIGGRASVVDLLLLAYAVPIQFLPLTLAALYWRRANRAGATWGLGAGLGTCFLAFALQQLTPAWYAELNPWSLQIGVLGVAATVAGLVAGSLLRPPLPDQHLARFEL
ncbi:MAG: sodium:solute symporter family protein [Deltaproteobacteria bacterium]|nr:sodium:solute symporter family protein [Deltaproteobacteria bacterium]